MPRPTQCACTPAWRVAEDGAWGSRRQGCTNVVDRVQKFPRLKTDILVRVVQPETQQVQVRSLANISLGGVFVCSPDQVVAGSALMLILHPPGNPFGGSARVVHTLDSHTASRKNHPQGFGVEFETLTDTAWQALELFVQDLTRHTRNTSPVPVAPEQHAVPVGAFRSHPRLEEHGRVTLNVDSHRALEDLWVHDFSRGGLFVETMRPPPVGTEVVVDLHAPTGELRLRAEVVHIMEASLAARTGHPPGVGLQFLDLSKGVGDALKRLVDGKGNAQPSAPSTATAPLAHVMAEAARFLAAVEHGDARSALGLPPGAPPSELAQRVDELRALFHQPPADASAPQSARLATAARVLARLDVNHTQRATPGGRSMVQSLPAGVDADHVRSLLVAARDLEAAGQPASAREVLQSLIELVPNHPGLRDRIDGLAEKPGVRNAADLLLAAERYATLPGLALTARAHAMEVTHRTQDPALLIRCLHLLMQIGSVPEATQVAQDICQAHPYEKAPWAVLLNIHVRAGQHRLALAAGEALLRLTPRDASLEAQVERLRTAAAQD